MTTPTDIDVIKIQVFKFRGFEVRTAGTFDSPLFCAADVCAILGLDNVGQALARLNPADVEPVTTSDVQGKNRRISYVTEAGMYKLVLRSRRPEAEAFVDWIASEVLPAIRKYGYYSAVEAERRKQTEWLLSEVFPKLPAKSAPIFRDLIGALLVVRRERGASGNPPWARTLASLVYGWALKVDGQQAHRRAKNPKPNGSRVDHSMFSDLAEESVRHVAQAGAHFAKISVSWAEWKTHMETVFGGKAFQPELFPRGAAPKLGAKK